jgi:DNA-binding transcriptional MerR regulator
VSAATSTTDGAKQAAAGKKSVQRAAKNGAASADMTIEQLSARSGFTVRNIRSHGARGLLPPPEVRNRIGYYGSVHLNRLRLIQDLQGEGFNLNGIKRLLEKRLGPAEQLLSFKRDLESFDSEEPPQTFTRDELFARFGEESDFAIKQAVKSGALVLVDEDRYEAPVPSLLDAAEAVVAQGVTLDHTLVVFAKAQSRCRSVAHEFVRLFLEDVWKPFEEDGYPEDRWPEVREALKRLRPLSSQALMAIYEMTMADEVDSAFGKQLERLSKRKS